MFEQILYNIVGGAIVSLLTYWGVKLLAYMKGRRFRNLFGFSTESLFYITYGLLELDKCFDEKGEQMKWPYIKPGVVGRFRISTLVSESQAKGVKYLSETFGRNSNFKPLLVSDMEIKDRLDISFCSIGGINNLKTNDVLNHEENSFFEFDLAESAAIILKNGSGVRFCMNQSSDYGFIIKIRPKSLRDKTWIAIAGLGESGTSGATWFLAKNWDKIEKKYGDSSFGLVIEVKNGKDESAKAVYGS